MENEHNNSGQKPETTQKLSKNTIVLIVVTSILAVVLIGLLITIPILQNMLQASAPTEPSTEPSDTNQTEPSIDQTEPAPSDGPKEWVMLDNMAELYEQNPDVTGWIRIDNTKIDYPVMYTPDEEDKYLRKDFKGNYHLSGLPLIDKDCTMDPDEESKSLIIYGHNMGNGTAFGTLKKYANKEYWEEYPLIHFSTLYEERTYEIVAAFYDKVYYSYDDVFKFYEFIDPETAEDYEKAFAEYKAKAEYDTGVEIKDGDRLITLVTCAYHTKNGRFVVVAREVTKEEMAERWAQEQNKT